MQIQENISLKPWHTFKTEAKARFFTVAGSPEEMIEALSFANTKILPYLILGGGSNILFTQDFPGIVIKNDIRFVKVEKENDTTVWVKAGAGEPWPEFVDNCVEHHWCGVENLSLIPGTVGASPVQNIGAYGIEVKDVIEQVEVLDTRSFKTKSLSNAECQFGYRNSIFKQEKGKWVVTAVTYRLQKQFTPNLNYRPLKDFFSGRSTEKITPKKISEAVKHIRRSKLPSPEELGNAGSFFKNPVIHDAQLNDLLSRFPDLPFFRLANNQAKLAAGWLIEQSGWKGKRLGDAGVHHRQALVLVNHGNAHGKEILNLAEKIRSGVKIKFGVHLEFEVNIL